MKKINVFLIGLSFFILFSCSDDFLGLTPPGAEPADGYFDTPERALAGLNATYEMLLHTDLWRIWLIPILESQSDDVLWKVVQGGEYIGFSQTASSATIRLTYAAFYKGVNRANLVIENVPEIEMDSALKDRYIAEAKFLRAFYYWNLAALWGEVPIFRTSPESPDDALVSQSSLREIYDFMIDDLETAAEILPVSYPSDQIGRATKGAAQALLGKVYLYDENYLQAEEWLGKVIDSQTYELVDDYQTIYHAEYENDAESIFEIQFQHSDTYSGMGSTRNQTGINDQQPLQSLVDAHEEGDPRLHYNIFLPGEPWAPHLGIPERDVWTGVGRHHGYGLKKGVHPLRLEEIGEVNHPLIRYADVLLMYAEAVNENGKLDLARDALNLIRQRPTVDMPPRTVEETSNKQDMFEAIVHERRIELAFEHHRFLDLQRWGLAEEARGSAGYSAPKHRWLPIPQTEIDINPLLEQPSGW